jgi:hypothetical protein
MYHRQRIAPCDAIKTVMIVALFGSAILWLPAMVDGGLEVFGRQVKRLEAVLGAFAESSFLHRRGLIGFG